MKQNLLAIDTSTERATVAISTQGAIYAEAKMNVRQHAQCLLPMIDQLLIKAGLTLSELDGIVFGCGPGSFTGLRITSSIVKALAYAHDLPLFPVTSLQAIAYDVYCTEDNLDQDVGILAMLDARMQEVYWAYFDDNMQSEAPQVSPATDVILPYRNPFVLAGVGLDGYVQQLSMDLQSCLLKQRIVFPTAEAMIRLVQLGNIQSVDAANALPIYVRNHVTQGEPRG